MFTSSTSLRLLLPSLLCAAACAPRINIIIPQHNAGQIKTTIRYAPVKHTERSYASTMKVSWSVPTDARYHVAAYRVKNGQLQKGKRVFHRQNVKANAIEFDETIKTDTKMFVVLTPANKAASNDSCKTLCA